MLALPSWNKYTYFSLIIVAGYGAHLRFVYLHVMAYFLLIIVSHTERFVNKH
ncbi:hypothetical protein [Aneurinibacillus aneurinilyticus]|uniref:hypothetical protein n=1 Tax=Aneurinibacillus aneurinilyticus TaxID=1391 RepID=UPI0023F58114|nr:hypothetical protein [Aneurinibacillus aneurinilyticus]